MKNGASSRDVCRIKGARFLAETNSRLQSTWETMFQCYIKCPSHQSSTTPVDLGRRAFKNVVSCWGKSVRSLEENEEFPQDGCAQQDMTAMFKEGGYMWLPDPGTSLTGSWYRPTPVDITCEEDGTVGPQ